MFNLFTLTFTSVFLLGDDNLGTFYAWKFEIWYAIYPDLNLQLCGRVSPWVIHLGGTRCPKGVAICVFWTHE